MNVQENHNKKAFNASNLRILEEWMAIGHCSFYYARCSYSNVDDDRFEKTWLFVIRHAAELWAILVYNK